MKHRIDKDGNLTDPSGKPVGKVDYDNRVRDGWHDRGHIDDDGRYHDEYGRDQGWTTRDTGDGGGAGLAGLVIILFIALFGWLWSKPGGRKFMTVTGIILLAGAAVIGLAALVVSGIRSVNDHARDTAQQQEIDWAVLNPDQAVTIHRVGDAPCQIFYTTPECVVTGGIYSLTNHLKYSDIQVTGTLPVFRGAYLKPGETVEEESEEDIEMNGTTSPVCFYMAIFPGNNKESVQLYTFDRPLCFSK